MPMPKLRLTSPNAARFSCKSKTEFRWNFITSKVKTRERTLGGLVSWAMNMCSPFYQKVKWSLASLWQRHLDSFSSLAYIRNTPFVFPVWKGLLNFSKKRYEKRGEDLSDKAEKKSIDMRGELRNSYFLKVIFRTQEFGYNHNRGVVITSTTYTRQAKKYIERGR